MPSCKVPDDIQSLADLLQRIDAEMTTKTECTGFFDGSTCPADRPAAGRCANQVVVCAKVCNDDSHCDGDSNGPTCSALKICETPMCGR